MLEAPPGFEPEIEVLQTIQDRSIPEQIGVFPQRFRESRRAE
jgi:hypothetical protein